MAFYDAKEHRKAYGPIYAYALCSAYQHQQVRKHRMVLEHFMMQRHFPVLSSTNRCPSTLWFKNTKIAKLKNMRSNDFEGVNTSQKILPILALHLGV